jgi:methylated-DNA-protein-cysteine methyltransferase-like protein
MAARSGPAGRVGRAGGARGVPQVDGKFRERVYEIVRLVPYGRVTTYGFVSTLAGMPRHARQVGWALHSLPDDLTASVPWHRVINAKGEVSTHPEESGTYRQIQRLREEGIEVSDDGVLLNGLAAHEWVPSPETVDHLELPAEVLFALDRQLELRLDK